MANLHFYLKNAKLDKKGLIPIILQVSFNYNKVRKQVGKTKKTWWNSNKQRVKELDGPYSGYKEINPVLDEFESKVRTTLNWAAINDIYLSPSNFWKYYKNHKELVKIVSFFDAFQEYIDMSKSNKAHNTIKGYTSVKNFLYDFSEDHSYPMDFATLDLTFFDLLKNYAFTDRRTQDNYFAKITSVLKAFLNWASERGYNSNQAYNKFSAKEREKEVIFLTLDELMILNNYEFIKEKHKKARDLYCFGCFTGLRISDILQLQYEHIKDGMIFKTIQKTKQIDKIPLNDFSKKILNKYDGISFKPLPSISAPRLNENIKECCKIAGIDQPVTITIYSGANMTQVTKPKHELITSHTARKTFVTNSLVLGMNTKTLKDITGHKNDSVFNRYIKIAEDFKREEMDNTWNKLPKN